MSNIEVNCGDNSVELPQEMLLEIASHLTTDLKSLLAFALVHPSSWRAISTHTIEGKEILIIPKEKKDKRIWIRVMQGFANDLVITAEEKLRSDEPTISEFVYSYEWHQLKLKRFPDRKYDIFSNFDGPLDSPTTLFHRMELELKDSKGFWLAPPFSRLSSVSLTDYSDGTRVEITLDYFRVSENANWVAVENGEEAKLHVPYHLSLGHVYALHYSPQKNYYIITQEL